MASKTVWRTGIGVGLFVLTMLSASAAEPFIEISTSGIEVDGMQRQRHRGVEVDWVRRVHLNPAALQAQDISVDLYDMTLLLIRDTRDPSARSAGEWLYETDERGSPNGRCGSRQVPYGRGPCTNGRERLRRQVYMAPEWKYGNLRAGSAPSSGSESCATNSLAMC
ncbi:hypothetical protein [Stenotrophomonas rhizophila]|uniref:hypothetical protein n=1 Tax=Stenotrophomonas rhizophila TaxID=216778 RepID=UPI003394E713